MCVLQVSLSHAVMPMVKMVPRGFTAAADAYLTPHILRSDKHKSCGCAGYIFAGLAGSQPSCTLMTAPFAVQAEPVLQLFPCAVVYCWVQPVQRPYHGGE